MFVSLKVSSSWDRFAFGCRWATIRARVVCGFWEIFCIVCFCGRGLWGGKVYFGIRKNLIVYVV